MTKPAFVCTVLVLLAAAFCGALEGGDTLAELTNVATGGLPSVTDGENAVLGSGSEVNGDQAAQKLKQARSFTCDLLATAFPTCNKKGDSSRQTGAVKSTTAPWCKSNFTCLENYAAKKIKERRKCCQGMNKCWTKMKQGMAKRKDAKQERREKYDATRTQVQKKRREAKMIEQKARAAQKKVMKAMQDQLKAYKGIIAAANFSAKDDALAGGDQLLAEAQEQRGSGSKLQAAEEAAKKAAETVEKAVKTEHKEQQAADEAEKAEDDAMQSSDQELAKAKKEEDAEAKKESEQANKGDETEWRGSFNATHAAENPQNNVPELGASPLDDQGGEHEAWMTKKVKNRCKTQVIVKKGRTFPKNDFYNDKTCTSCQPGFALHIVFSKYLCGRCKKLDRFKQTCTPINNHRAEESACPSKRNQMCTKSQAFQSVLPIAKMYGAPVNGEPERKRYNNGKITPHEQFKSMKGKAGYAIVTCNAWKQVTCTGRKAVVCATKKNLWPVNFCKLKEWKGNAEMHKVDEESCAAGELLLKNSPKGLIDLLCKQAAMTF